MRLPVGFPHLLLIITIMSATRAMAGISLDATRIIFDANNKMGMNVQVNSSQTSSTPYLVKTQVTEDINGQHTDVPFITTPSLFRLDPGNSNQVRILPKQHTFPKDKESVFYFRAVALPTQSDEESEGNRHLTGDLQLASGNVIKLFYRPAGLTLPREKAANKLTFSATRNGVKVTNPTPYFLTLTSLKINGQAVNIRTKPGSNMIPPQSDMVFFNAPHQGRVQWQVINDYGGAEIFNGILQ